MKLTKTILLICSTHPSISQPQVIYLSSFRVLIWFEPFACWWDDILVVVRTWQRYRESLLSFLFAECFISFWSWFSDIQSRHLCRPVEPRRCLVTLHNIDAFLCRMSFSSTFFSWGRFPPLLRTLACSACRPQGSERLVGTLILLIASFCGSFVANCVKTY